MNNDINSIKKGAGKYQSPIDIELESSIFDKNLKPIHIKSSILNENNKCLEIWNITNNGHSGKL